MSGRQLGAVLAAELTKIRSVRSAISALLATAALSTVLGYLVGLAFRHDVPHLPSGQSRLTVPLFAGFYSITLGQLALVTFGVIVVGSEYRGGMIRSSLAAIPQRGLFYGGKVLASALAAAAVAVPTVVLTFLAAQAGLGPSGISLTAPGAPQAVLGACLYLVIICLLAVGTATILRSSARALGLLIPLLFLGSQGLGNVPGLKAVTDYLPDEAGMVIMHLAGAQGDGRFARPYGPWAGLGIAALWAAAALLGGYLALSRTDA